MNNSFRFNAVWDQIARVEEEFKKNTKSDSTTKGEISVVMREDTPNAKIRTVFSSFLTVDLGKKPSNQLFAELRAIVQPVILNSVRNVDTATEILLERENNSVFISTTTLKMWFVDVRTAEIIAQKIGRRKEDSLAIALEKLKVSVSRFVNNHHTLDVHIKNGNLSTIKRIKHSIDLEKELGLPSLKKTLHENLFENRTQNQCELTALFRGGNFERCEKANREEFNCRA
jgi:hypothetical protein